MRGFWADERVEGGIWNIKNPLFKWIYTYFKKKEKEFIREADSIISLTDNAKGEIISWKVQSSTADKISVIPTCVDLTLFNPGKVKVNATNEIRKNLSLNPEDFILLYLGSLGTWYMLNEMLDFYDILRKQVVNTKFLFLTKDLEILSESIRGRGYEENEIMITSASREEVPKYISLSSASIFFIIPTFSKKASSATKMGEIMAMGKPVITNSGWGDVDEIITQKIGIIIRDFKEDAYKNSIGNLLELVKTKPLEIRKTAEKYYSLKKGVELYDNIYQRLTKE
jgi:glycosyltransferase involved in cell wall biosynthesis